MLDTFVNRSYLIVLYCYPFTEVGHFTVNLENFISETTQHTVCLLPLFGKPHIDSIQDLGLKLIDVGTVHLRNLKANLLVPRLELIQSLVHLVDDVADLLCSLNCWLDYLVDNAAGSVLKCEPLAVGAVDLAPGRLMLAEVKPRE